MSKPSLVAVLVEDERQQRFVRHYLYRKGFSRHDIRFEPLLDGAGCGEQWVRERYPVAVKAYRARSGRAETALIIAIDADTGPTEQRQRQLRQALIEDGQPERREREPVVHLIPKRSIETWVLVLSGKTVDEDTDYSRDGEVDSLVVPAARAFFEASRSNAGPPPPYVASLLAAIPEMRRLE